MVKYRRKLRAGYLAPAPGLGMLTPMATSQEPSCFFQRGLIKNLFYLSHLTPNRPFYSFSPCLEIFPPCNIPCLHCTIDPIFVILIPQELFQKHLHTLYRNSSQVLHTLHLYSFPNKAASSVSSLSSTTPVLISRICDVFLTDGQFIPSRHHSCDFLAAQTHMPHPHHLVNEFRPQIF